CRRDTPCTLIRYCVRSSGAALSATRMRAGLPVGGHFGLFVTGPFMRSNRTDHIRLTSHPVPGGKSRFPIHWGAASPHARGPIIGPVPQPQHRNVIGSHGGSYALYRALAVSAGALDPIRRSDLTNTHPAATIGPFPQWSEPGRIASLDPWGHLVAAEFKAEIAAGEDIRPTIAITRARLDL